MKKVLLALLSLSGLLLNGCGNDKVVLTRKCVILTLVVHDDPNYATCELRESDFNDDKFWWEGKIDKYVINPDMRYYTKNWCEYSNGTHIIEIGNY